MVLTQHCDTLSTSSLGTLSHLPIPEILCTVWLLYAAAEQSEDTGMHAESERSCNLPAKFLTVSVTQAPAVPCTVLTLPCTHVQLNTGQTDGAGGKDLHVEPVWRQGITGSGVVVTVVDEGETDLECTPLGHASHAG